MKEYEKLKAELPMSSAMFCCLINNYIKTTLKCCSCPHFNGECKDFAEQGKCKAMDVAINDILVFNDGDIEYATTRRAISKALEYNLENGENPWQGETVGAVIEDYKEEAPFGENNIMASMLYNLLSPSDIIYEIKH